MRDPRIVPAGCTGRLPWAMLPVILLWLAATALREAPAFWRNEGGYPVPLRLLVLNSYYPVTVALALALAVGGYRALVDRRTMPRCNIFAWLAVAAAMGAGLVLASANNFSNLVEGRPFHYHAPIR